MKKIAVTGISGVIGQILINSLSIDGHVIDLFRKIPYSGPATVHARRKLDILNTSSVDRVLSEIEPDVIVHMAAITHIDECEKDKKNGKSGNVWKTNVDGSREIARFCAANNIQLVFMSTECVFDGKKEAFSEDDEKKPINWYGMTKSEAENQVLETGAKAAILRSVVAYHQNDNNRTIYGKVLHKLQNEKQIQIVQDQLFTPTYTYDIVEAIRRIVDNFYTGIFHVAPKIPLTPFEFANLLAQKHRLHHVTIEKSTIESLYGLERAALRLRNSCLSGEKTSKELHFIPQNLSDVLKSI